MTAAWLHAGARCVVASPAAVNDEAAYDVLTGVHAAARRRRRPARGARPAVPGGPADDRRRRRSSASADRTVRLQGANRPVRAATRIRQSADADSSSATAPSECSS